MRSMSSDSVKESPVSSFSSFAAAPEKVPESSIMPAGISGKARDPAAMRGWMVRMVWSSFSSSLVASSGWRRTCVLVSVMHQNVITPKGSD